MIYACLMKDKHERKGERNIKKESEYLRVYNEKILLLLLLILFKNIQ